MKATSLRRALPAPLLLGLAIVLFGLLGMPWTTWITLTVAGLGMGLMLFVMAAGMTLSFGLMDVLNLGHGALIALGGFVGATVAAALQARWHAPGLLGALTVAGAAYVAAFVVLAPVGVAFEALFVRPVYRDPLRQILVTVGASYLIAELLKAIWGPASLSMGMPSSLVGGLSLGGVVIEKYRLLAAACGLLVYLGLQALVHRTRAGLLIRAGVENVEMVEALGYRVRLLFLAVFVGGAALAGLGGAMWGLYQGQVSTGMGAEMLVMIIIVVIMGGLGSISGCLYASVLVGLLSNYTTYIVPTVSLFSSIGLLVVVLLAWPRGLLPAR